MDLCERQPGHPNYKLGRSDYIGIIHRGKRETMRRFGRFHLRWRRLLRHLWRQHLEDALPRAFPESEFKQQLGPMRYAQCTVWLSMA